MRELKFRAWDRVKHKMLYGVSPFNAHITDENEPLLSLEYSKHDDCEFMQYTGIKDKNGKDVYDGDVIYSSSYFKKKGGKRFVAQKPYRNPIAVIEWDDDSGAFSENQYENGEFQIGGFLFEATGEWESLKGTEKNVIEVLGNIHENPELLEEEE